jgi:HEAT repeat protein
MPRFMHLIAALLISTVMLALASPATSQEVLGKDKAEWIKILKSDPKPELRRAAVIALGIIGPTQKDVLPELSKALTEDKDEFVRLQVVAILGTAVRTGERKKDQPEVRDVLATLVDVLKDDKSAAVRAQTASLIGKLGEHAKPAIGNLESALKDESAGVRAAAANALGQIGVDAKATFEKMVPLFRDSDSNVRFATAYASARIGADPLAVVPYLNQLIESDASVDVRREAAKSIGLIGAPAAKAAVPALIKALTTDKEDEIRRQAALALGKMGIEVNFAMKDILRVFREDKDTTVRLYLIRSMSSALGRGMRSFVKDLAECLPKEPDGNVRLAIVQEFGALGVDAVDALPALQQAESDVSLQIREAARQAIDRIRKPAKKDIKN